MSFPGKCRMRSVWTPSWERIPAVETSISLTLVESPSGARNPPSLLILPGRSEAKSTLSLSPVCGSCPLSAPFPQAGCCHSGHGCSQPWDKSQRWLRKAVSVQGIQLPLPPRWCCSLSSQKGTPHHPWPASRTAALGFSFSPASPYFLLPLHVLPNFFLTQVSHLFAPATAAATHTKSKLVGSQHHLSQGYYL